MLRKLGDETVEEIAGVGPLQRRDQQRIAEPQAIQLVGAIAVDLAVRLVAHQDDRPPSSTQRLGDLLVQRSHAVAYVDHEAAHIGLGDRHLRLLARRSRQRCDVRWGVTGQGHVQTGGVHHREALPAPLHHSVQPIPRQPCERIDDRAPRPGEPVEERRLADVGPPDDRDNAHRGRNRIRFLATAPASGAGRAHFPPPGTGEVSIAICANGAPSSSRAKALTSSAPDAVVRQMM